ncbi:hypothetical protein BAT_2761 [Bacillus pumilus ATCC 7061]|nr:hypothetical protein BAT_2761 [Bacillus pumilus ATCC 7061]
MSMKAIPMTLILTFFQFTPFCRFLIMLSQPVFSREVTL